MKTKTKLQLIEFKDDIVMVVFALLLLIAVGARYLFYVILFGIIFAVLCVFELPVWLWYKLRGKKYE